MGDYYKGEENIQILEKVKKAIISKLEYTKKKKYLEKDAGFQSKIKIIDKMINDEVLTIKELDIFYNLLEYSFKKKLFQIIQDYGIYYGIPDKPFLDYNLTETALSIITNCQFEEEKSDIEYKVHNKQILGD